MYWYGFDFLSYNFFFWRLHLCGHFVLFNGKSKRRNNDRLLKVDCRHEKMVSSSSKPYGKKD